MASALYLGELSKGESIHALRRDVFYAHEGAVRRRHLQEQTDQAWCLTITTNAISTWTAEYLGLAVAHISDQDHHIDDKVLAHISPAQSENIGLFGTITSTSMPNSPDSDPPATASCASHQRSSRKRIDHATAQRCGCEGGAGPQACGVRSVPREADCGGSGVVAAHRRVRARPRLVDRA